MENTYVQNLIDDCRKERFDDIGWHCTSTDYTDPIPFGSFLARVCRAELNDETFDFAEVSKLTANLYRLFVTVDKLGGFLNKDIARLILQIDKFTALQTEAKGISLVQSMLKLMITQFLGHTLTSKPRDQHTHKVIVFDAEDKGKSYSDKYFSFGHEGNRYIVKTDTFDLADILTQI